MEFVHKSKKLKLTIAGKVYEMKCPTLGDRERFDEKLKLAKPAEATNMYLDFFAELGGPRDLIKETFDGDDLIDFINFILYPKKKPATE